MQIESKSGDHRQYVSQSVRRRGWQSVLIQSAFACAMLASCQQGAFSREQLPERPNIIYVMTDDQGYGDIAAHGNPILRTPHLDAMHRESVRFTEFHASPTCAPTRAALLTGRHEFHSGVTHTIFERERLALTSVTFPELLRSSGYKTGIFGKWHLGDEDAYQPNQRGFDRVFIHGAGGIGQSFPGSCGDVPGNSYYNPIVRSDGTFVQTKGYCTDVFFDAAMEWIDKSRQREEPFFCFITPNAPHGPLDEPPGSAEPYANQVPQDVAKFYGMIENIDTNIGRLLERLELWKLSEKTLVIFTTDNGTATGAKVFNDGMRASKGSPYRGGTRVPAFWRWKGVLSEGIDVPALTAHIDVLPTLCELAGVTIESQVAKTIEGRSLVPLLIDAQAMWPQRHLVTHAGRWDRGQATQSKYRNCRIHNGSYSLANTKNSADGWELYDLRKDPGEKENIATQEPSIVKDLSARFDDWWMSVEGELVNEDLDGPAENSFQTAYEKQQATTDNGPRSPPNVLVILSDDQRADTIHSLGNPHIRTPALDRLVARGTSFSRAYCMGSMQGAVCVPSRAMLLSGQSLFAVDEKLSKCDAWPNAFTRAGYSPFVVGKWHNGLPSARRLFGSGASVFLGGMTNQWNVAVTDFQIGQDPIETTQPGAYSSVVFADVAIAHLGKQPKQTPFFLWVAMTAPHDPRQAPKEFRDRSHAERPKVPNNYLPQHPFDNGEMTVRDEQLLRWPRTKDAVSEELADYYATIEAMDEQIGKLLDCLESSGRLADTIVLFTSDSGLAIGSHGLMGKQNLYEHSSRVPAIMAGPGVPQGKQIESLCYLHDLMATVGDLAEVEAPEMSDGKSLVPIMQGRVESIRDNLVLAYRNVQRALVTPQWKLIRYPQIHRTQLFDIHNDPEEVTDISSRPEQASRVQELVGSLKQELQRSSDTLALTVENPLPEAWTPPVRKRP